MAFSSDALGQQLPPAVQKSSEPFRIRASVKSVNATHDCRRCDRVLARSMSQTAQNLRAACWSRASAAHFAAWTSRLIARRLGKPQ